MGGWIDGWEVGLMNGWMGGWIDGWEVGLMDGWMGGWIDGWEVGLMDDCGINSSYKLSLLGHQVTSLLLLKI